MAEEKKGLKPRPPIVVVMGHVDHGKTTLLDYIRKTNVAAKEAGGITQSIGAYEIIHYPGGNPSADSGRPSGEGRKITFIDTPGHEAFSKMRSRGAHIADLAILVVAADEGVKPQTVESIKTLKETQTPFIVAVTKTDKPGADLEKVKNELTANEVLLEGYGGNVSYQPVSAKTGEHVNELLDLILLAAQLENLAYEPNVPGNGYILETKVDPRRGIEATIIVENGVLKQGEYILTPTAQGKIKILEDFLGKTTKTLEPSAPALVIGFENIPEVGEQFMTGEAASRELIARPQAQLTKKSAAPLPAVASAKAGLPAVVEDKNMLRIVLKASDTGSLEALSDIINAIGVEKPVKIISESVGDVRDTDIKTATATNATIVAFKSRVDKSVKMSAETNNVPIVTSEIIYDLVKTIEDLMKELGKPKYIGSLEVLAIFNQAKPAKQLVGGKVVDGIFKNKTVLEIEREKAVVGTGRILNLQQQKKDAHQVNAGNEAGLIVSSETLIKVGDRLIIQELPK